MFACSSVLVEKDSVFQSHAAVGLINKNDIERFRAHVLATVDEKPTHGFMFAAVLPRCGTTPPVVLTDDDGEKGAGMRLRSVITSHRSAAHLLRPPPSTPRKKPLNKKKSHREVKGDHVDDHRQRGGVCVCVTRWYGGVELGGLRFQLISDVAKSALDNVP